MSTTLRSNVIDVTFILLGAALVPVYFLVYRESVELFNIMQSIHVILVSLYVVLYLNTNKSHCFESTDVGYNILNIVTVYTMFMFFFMLILYVYRFFQ